MKGIKFMYAGVVEFSFAPEYIDKVVQWYDQEVIPAAKKIGGLKGAILLSNSKTGNSIGVGFWESKEQADAYEATGTLRNLLQKLADEGVTFIKLPARSEYTVEHADLEFTIS